MPDQASSAAATARLERITSQLAPDVFRTLGHDLVDRIADFLNRLPSLPVTPGESPEVVRALLPTGSLPEQGAERGALLAETTEMLLRTRSSMGIRASLVTSHRRPRRWGCLPTCWWRR